jgi:hypothetical protein
MATTGLAEVFPIAAGLNNFHEVRRIAPNKVEGCSPSALTVQIELIDEQTPRLDERAGIPELQEKLPKTTAVVDSEMD